MGAYPNECYTCGFHDCDYGSTCPSHDMFYACPIENKKPENKKLLDEMIEAWEGRNNDEFFQNSNG